MTGLLGGETIPARSVYEADRFNRLAHQVIAMRAAGVGAKVLAAYMRRTPKLEVVRFA